MTASAEGGAQRPLCPCHGEPQWRAGHGRFTCSVRERERNALRIRVTVQRDDIFVGRAPSPDVTEAFRGFIQQHRQEVKDGWVHTRAS